jgi:hypothetical protein
VTYNRIGLSDSDKQVIKAEKASNQAQTFVANLADAARAATNGQAVTGGTN